MGSNIIADSDQKTFCSSCAIYHKLACQRAMRYTIASSERPLFALESATYRKNSRQNISFYSLSEIDCWTLIENYLFRNQVTDSLRIQSQQLLKDLPRVLSHIWRGTLDSPGGPRELYGGVRQWNRTYRVMFHWHQHFSLSELRQLSCRRYIIQWAAWHPILLESIHPLAGGSFRESSRQQWFQLSVV